MKIANFTDSERMKTPRTDCALKVYKDKEFYQLGFQVYVDLENTGFPATLNAGGQSACLSINKRE